MAFATRNVDCSSQLDSPCHCVPIERTALVHGLLRERVVGLAEPVTVAEDMYLSRFLVGSNASKLLVVESFAVVPRYPPSPGDAYVRVPARLEHRNEHVGHVPVVLRATPRVHERLPLVRRCRRRDQDVLMTPRVY